MKFKNYKPLENKITQYLFFTGKGGVGKTSTACATAVALADSGKKVLLISTDPASNLQDVFETELSNRACPFLGFERLMVANLDPIEAAKDYKESVVGPYRGKLPEEVIANMEEQLSGSCTVEIAAFNEFSNFITDKDAQLEYDHIIFDTAPTGHTLRMLQLPSAWSGFISENTHGASCLGQLSGLESKKEIYEKAVETLADSSLTTLVLVARPEDSPLKEARRASKELADIGVKNQWLILNGMLLDYDDEISKGLYDKQATALENMPAELKDLETCAIPLRGYNVVGAKNIRAFLSEDNFSESLEQVSFESDQNIDAIVEDLYKNEKKVIFTMGKGGVGKTTIAAAIALGLAARGEKVHLTTTDPAAHLQYVVKGNENITLSHIDEEKVLEDYKKTVLAAAGDNLSAEDIAYIEEDLRSPCTQEIAVFRAFAQIVEKADEEVVVIDTAPTGHTLLLLDSTQSYHKEIERTQGDIPESVRKLLPRLRNDKETEVIIVSLAETTPVFEAKRLEIDLARAGIYSKWWVINSSLYATKTENKLLKAKAESEIQWINDINRHTEGNLALVRWYPEDVKEEMLLSI
ncbi:arsenical pump-driving ATPase [Alkalibacter saccharofermentans]|uniref:Arsenite efflux ATP-binding protein ArsA n=1 Tax=Alkalibacter saccharofermentans DSM 14828 TaxID=1120975 RepID=A0A1M4YL89_9FIRM|nr:arsenical pump-driving ATPase [Alkalibacter saccharofermentans]SHF06520.1 arsenite efflux ATP-binding protein ArsA [Alkalibacter saccharofermentans DSM 14828]